MQLGENFKLSSQVYNFNSTSLYPTFVALVILAQIQTHVFKKRFKLHLTVRKNLATGIRQMERRPATIDPKMTLPNFKYFHSITDIN
jgi:hypothetical protein